MFARTPNGYRHIKARSPPSQPQQPDRCVSARHRAAGVFLLRQWRNQQTRRTWGPVGITVDRGAHVGANPACRII